jgi:UDP-glucose 4-epimerase
MRVLVTGGSGFIGSNLVDALLADGAEVTVVDDLSTGRRENLEGAIAAGARLHVADLTDRVAMVKVFESSRPDVVMHLGAQIDVRRSVDDPPFDARINVVGTAGLLETSRRSGARRFVFASTGGALYGAATTIPTPEDAPIEPMSPYGAGKAAAEGYLRLYHRLYGLSTLALRFGNVYGPRQDPHGEAGVIAIFCGAAAEGRPVTAFGDGTQTRDYVYVGDVVDAFRAAAAAAVTGALNVGTGRETSVLEIAQALGVEVEHAPARLGELDRSCLDVTAAARALDWRARVDLREGLRRTLAAVPRRS